VEQQMGALAGGVQDRLSFLCCMQMFLQPQHSCGTCAVLCWSASLQQGSYLQHQLCRMLQQPVVLLSLLAMPLCSISAAGNRW
jgi:hypothetical protein